MVSTMVLAVHLAFVTNNIPEIFNVMEIVEFANVCPG